jgi:hypothetical protein
MSEWQPLTDIWDLYDKSMATAVESGLLDGDEEDVALAEQYVWPVDLHIGDWEQEDVQKYVNERMTEIVGKIKNHGGLSPNLIAAYLFRSVMCGMLWERERIG